MKRKRKSRSVGWPRWLRESDVRPCGSRLADAVRCRPSRAAASPNIAAELMRSRYHACVMGIEHYLPASWHRSTRPPSVDGDCALHWLGLEIRRQGKLVGQPRPADDQSNATQGESPASAR